MSEDVSDEALDDAWGDALKEQEGTGADADWGDALKEQEDAESFASARFQELGEGSAGRSMPTGDEIKMDVILDIPVTISMEIGRTLISIRNLLQLNQGSVVELDRFAGEPMDVLVNGTLIAHGEVVVVNDKFGIRLTDVISPTERVRHLG
ncbi:MAG: flagellar motor switch protein FliN [Methylococcales bacterium]|nr:flagellar motor switch protein FliN [Methylococcales bacterium]